MVTLSISQFLRQLDTLDIKLWLDNGQLRANAPKGAITPELHTQIGQHKEALLQFLSKASQVHQPALATIQPAPRTESKTIPLSFMQESLWLLEQFELSNTAYNEIGALQLEGNLQIGTLERALAEIVQRHESLRTTFSVTATGEPCQVIHPAMFDLPLHDLSHLAADIQQNRIQTLAYQETHTRFNLAQGPLLRCHLLRLQQDTTAAVHVLLIAMHHLIVDVWSIGLFFQELSTLYAAFSENRPSPLPPLPVQYADYAIWQRTQMQGDFIAARLDYWRQKLAGAPALLPLPTDRPRPPQQTFQGSHLQFTINADLTRQLRALAQQNEATLFMVLLAAFNVLLAHYSRQDDILIGAPIANRQQPEVEAMIGFFVNTLVYRTQLVNNPTFTDLLAQVKQTTQEAYAHQDLAFAAVVAAVQPARDFSYSPLVQVMFAFQNIPTIRNLAIAGLRLNKLDLPLDLAKYDLSLEVREAGQSLLGTFEYNTSLFEAATIQRMVGHFQTLLQAIVADTNQPIAHLPLLTEAERRQLLVDWNDTAADYPQDKCIHQLFEEQVERTPDAMAVIMAGGNQIVRLRDCEIGQGDDQSPNLLISQSLTYAELNARANQLAQHLQSLGVGPETLVGICVERSPAMVVGLLGILKAGGAYLPLDPTYPPERLAFLLQDAAPRVIVTQARYQHHFPATTRLVCLDTDATLIDEQSTHNPGTAVSPTQLAYVIYTSGSTGQPKGVLVEQRGLANLALAQIQAFGVQAGDRVLQVASLNFDVSIWEIVMALGAGATLVLATTEDLLPGPALTQTLQQQAITHVTLVPTALALLDPEALPGLQTLIVAGEACPAALAARWAQGRRFFNAYGPTEITVCATMMECGAWRDPQQAPPIGRPLANTQVYMLDRTHQPVPIGVPGELYIGGIGVARGYLNRPELTAERFIVNPFGAGRLYKSGDLARWLPDGNIEYLGRIDQQVKLRGFRIELGEIEAVLRQHPAVQDAVVVAREDTPGEKRLVAYVVPNQETEWQASSLILPKDDKDRVAEEIPLSPPHPLTWSALRRHVQAKLPDYMLPSAFVELDALPLTPNGKVDRKALPAPVNLRSSQDKTFVAPRTATERALADIWSAVLGVEQIGIHDNFFEVGGHSLLATQVVSRISEACAVTLPLRTLFQAPTIAALADALVDAQLAQNLQTPPATTGESDEMILL